MRYVIDYDTVGVDNKFWEGSVDWGNVLTSIKKALQDSLESEFLLFARSMLSSMDFWLLSKATIHFVGPKSRLSAIRDL